jgi:hypothetical protein
MERATMMPRTIDFLSWARSDDTSDDDEEEDDGDDDNVLVIEEDFSEYESFHFENQDADWVPTRPPSSLFQNLFSQDPLPNWSSFRTTVRSKLESFQSNWDQKMKQSQVLAEETVASLSSVATFWGGEEEDNLDLTQCPTPTSSNRTPRWGCGFMSSSSSRTSPVHKLEMAPLRSPQESGSSEEEEEEYDEEEYDFVSVGSSSSWQSDQSSIFFASRPPPPPFPLRRV